MVKKAASKKQVEQKTSVLAILSLIFAFVFPLVGLILGIIALVEIRKNSNLKGKGLAIAGIVVSGVIIIFSILVILAVILFAISNSQLTSVSDIILSVI